MVSTLLLDLEANGFVPDKIFCICTQVYPKGEKKTFLDTEDFKQYLKDNYFDLFVAHNGINYDFPVINRLVEQGLIPLDKVLDTFVLSRLLDYNRFNTHSLKELGEYLGVYKGDYTGGFDAFSKEMVEYCEQDVEVLHAILDLYYKDYMDPVWKDPLKTEQEMAALCTEMNKNGFTFDLSLCTSLLKEVKEEMDELEEEFNVYFPSNRVELKRLQAKKTKDGKYYSRVQQAMDEYDDWELDGDELIVYHKVPFKPGSPIDRIDVLWDAGWKPFDKTKGHVAMEREEWKKRRRG